VGVTSNGVDFEFWKSFTIEANVEQLDTDVYDHQLPAISPVATQAMPPQPGSTPPSGSPPAAPGGVTAIYDSSGDGAIDLEWDDNSNNETGFNVYASYDGGATWTTSPVATLLADQTTTVVQPPPAPGGGAFQAPSGGGGTLHGGPVFKLASINLAGTATSGPATTQASYKITPYLFGGQLFTLKYVGPGHPNFFQTVAISGSPVTTDVRNKEKADHGGEDAFNGPVPDNSAGDPNQPVTATRIPGGWQMIDKPSFPPPYPTDFVGTKSFVTTVKDGTGSVLPQGTILWHISQDANGKITGKIDSQY
jgi:hypothetical protein